MNFSPVTQRDYERLLPFFSNQHHELCTYSLSSIIAWQNNSYAPYAAVVDNVLLIAAEYTKKPQDRHLILPVSQDDDLSPQRLSELAKEAGHEQYWFVPENYVAWQGADDVARYFDIFVQHGYSDYIYRKSDLADLPGEQYHKKRNLIRQFEKTHAMDESVVVKEIERDDVGGCMEFLEEWCLQRDCGRADDSDIACERKAAENALQSLALTGWRGLVLKIEGKVSAFGLASRLTDKMGTLNFEKAFSSVKGLYQYFDRECARRLFNDFTFINKESDMGEPGLMKAKRSYHPVGVVSSYILTLK
jgi:hypothetical protein